jgi:amidophosphoribosyltransferase
MTGPFFATFKYLQDVFSCMALPMLPAESSSEPHEACGVAAVYLKKDLSHYPKGGALFFLQKMLLQLQHRGQLSAGVTIYNDKKPDLLKTHKGNGLVNEVFCLSDTEKVARLFNDYAGTIGIGHTRYATSGSDACADAQPFERVHARMWKWFSFAFNGNVTNAPEIRAELKEKGYHFKTHADTEALMHLIAHQLGGDAPNSLENAFADLSTNVDGAYNLAFLNARGELCVIRDSFGFKPMCYIDTEEFFLAASESVALFPFVQSGIQDLKPGEMVRVYQNKLVHSRFSPSTHPVSHCMFEWVYFASPGSTMQGTSVYEARYRLGEELAKAETLLVNPSEYVVVNVPDTSKPAGDAYAYTLGLPSKEGLLRNRYVGRTFIEGGKWQDKVKEKFTINPHVMQGKKVILIEDSIVRGSTLRALALKIKEEGKALEVHARISCPPIFNPCFYGIDMTTFSELTAARHGPPLGEREKSGTIDALEKTLSKELHVDSLRYQTIEGLIRALRVPSTNLCMACLNGKYPTPFGKTLVKEAWSHHLKNQSGRVYDA